MVGNRRPGNVTSSSSLLESPFSQKRAPFSQKRTGATHCMHVFSMSSNEIHTSPPCIGLFMSEFQSNGEVDVVCQNESAGDGRTP